MCLYLRAGMPACPAQDHCQPGCLPKNTAWAGTSGSHNACNGDRDSESNKKSARDHKCCGPNVTGCGWFQTPLCADDANKEQYPCVCAPGKPEGSLGDVMTAAGVTDGSTGVPFGWRAQPEHAGKTYEEAKGARAVELEGDATYAPHIDPRGGY